VKVPFLDLKAQYNSLKDEISVELHNAMDNTAFAGANLLLNLRKNLQRTVKLIMPLP
jgi:hypothetical protein